MVNNRAFTVSKQMTQSGIYTLPKRNGSDSFYFIFRTV